MKKVHLFSFIAFNIFFACNTFAQQNNFTELLKPEFKHTYEIGVSGFGYHFNNIMPEVYLNRFQTTNSRGLIFKRSLSDKFILRVTAETDRITVNHAGTQYFEAADSMNIAGNYRGNKLSAGIERRWIAGKRLLVNGGIDIQLSQYIYRGSMEHTPSIYKHIDNAIYSTAGISPFIGMQYNVLQKFNIGFETSFAATYIHRNSYIEVVRPEPGTYHKISNRIDVNPNPISRVFVTYCF